MHTIIALFLDMETAMNLTIPSRVTHTTSPFMTSPVNNRMSYIPQSSPDSTRGTPEPEQASPSRPESGKSKTTTHFRPWVCEKENDETQMSPSESSDSGKLVFKKCLSNRY